MSPRRWNAFLAATIGCLMWLVFPASSVRGDVRLAPLFTSDMVLQRGRPIRIWGTAEPGEDVRVAIADKTDTARANDRGDWLVELPVIDAGESLSLRVEGKNTVVLENVIIGDVWLCSGQSNMAWPLHACNAKPDIAAATFPRIRRIKIKNVTAPEPVADVTADTPWQVCTPETAGGFTGLGFYFAREISTQTGVPIGILDCAWNGTRIERWIGRNAAAAVPELARDLATRGGAGWSDIHNAMVWPLARFPIMGVLWYQGESNANEGDIYFHKMRALIGGWRSEWGRDDLPAYFVQLTSHGKPNPEPAGGDGCVRVREAQRKALSIPRTGMAVTIDTVSQKEALANLHPSNKHDVGVRLARWALARDYGRADTEPSGPLFRSMQVEGDRIRIAFEHVGEGLMIGSKAGREPVVEDAAGPLRRFAIAGADRTWAWAEATIDGDTVVVSSPDVKEPVAVRYAYSGNPEGANLYNRAGLPASPFRTDSW